MKCEKCGNEYNSQYYFATPTICKECFDKMPNEEQQRFFEEAASLNAPDPLSLRVGFGKRLAAAILDVIYLFVITTIFDLIVGYSPDTESFMTDFLASMGDPEKMQALMMDFLRQNQVSYLVSFLIPAVYYLLEVFLAASLGKMTLGIKIADENMNEASSGRLWLRYFVKHSPYMIGIVWILTLFMGLTLVMSLAFVVIYLGFFLTLTRKKQDIQDLIAKTAVYHKRDVKAY